VARAEDRLNGRDAFELLAWWVVLFALYLALISTISLTEIVVGATAAVACAVAAVVSRRTLLAADGDERYRPRARWLRWLVPLPVQVVTGAVRLLRPRGEFTEVRLPEDPRAAARRGFAVLALSVAPTGNVADVDPERNVLVVHRLDGRPTALEREVTR
jgi:multisubunit Na+/H+ antiporter MnhE subunit